MKYRIARTQAEAVAVGLQFPDHVQTEDGSDGGVVQDVQAEKTNEEITGYFIGIRYRPTIMVRPRIFCQSVRDIFAIKPSQAGIRLFKTGGARVLAGIGEIRPLYVIASQ